MQSDDQQSAQPVTLPAASNPFAPALPRALPVFSTPQYEQPQWRPGMSEADLRDFRTLRDVSINARIARIYNERRASGYVPPGEVMINPLGANARVTSLPAASRLHPTENEYLEHTGLDEVPVDYHPATDPPPPVYASSSGEIVYIGRYSERSGMFVMVMDKDNRIHNYAHLVEGSTGDLKVGDQLVRGQQFALMGNTGPVDAQGNPRLRPHLHHGVRILDPEKQLQSQMAYSQRESLRGLTVQPVGSSMLTDPALNYWEYRVVNPPYEGQTYTSVGAPIPAPSSQYALIPRTTSMASANAAPSPTGPDTQNSVPASSRLPITPGMFPPGVFDGLDVRDQTGPGNTYRESRTTAPAPTPPRPL